MSLIDPKIGAICLVGGACVYIVHKLVNDRVLRMFLPSTANEIIQKRKGEDETFAQTCRTNGTAFLHSFIVAPVALYCMFLCTSLLENPLWGRAWPLTINGWIMISYFVWDIAICIMRYKIYGTLFFLHAVVSCLGLLYQFSLIQHPWAPAPIKPTNAWHTAAFMATEISTPLMHIRWMLIQSKQTQSLYFKIINALFIITFIGYRMGGVQLLVFLPVVKHGFRSTFYSVSEKILIVFIFTSWTGLNVSWGIMLLDSQMKRLKKAMTSEKSE